MNSLKQGLIELLSDAIVLQHVMHCQLACCPSGSQMLVESMAQVFTSVVGVQYLDPIAVLLGECPWLIGFVCVECLIFGVQ
jgi:hypothetical protein